MRTFVIGILLTASAAGIAAAAELQHDTLLAWDAYTKESDVRLQQRGANRPFLWTDESPDRAARVRRGEVVIAPVVGKGSESVPHGLIHDWIGAVFIPGATLDSVRSVVHDYDSYHEMYQPVVVSSKTLGCTDDTQDFQMVWQRKVLFVSAALQGRYHARDLAIDAHRGYSIAESVEVREIEHFRRPDQNMLPPDTGNGFIWRIRSVARFEERDGGVYLELEAMALTRDIPGSLAWMVNPVVNHLSVNSLTTTLRQTRGAITAGRPVETAASCRLPARGTHSAKSLGSE
jgi:hypothetical protein